MACKASWLNRIPCWCNRITYSDHSWSNHLRSLFFKLGFFRKFLRFFCALRCTFLRKIVTSSIFQKILYQNAKNDFFPYWRDIFGAFFYNGRYQILESKFYRNGIFGITRSRPGSGLKNPAASESGSLTSLHLKLYIVSFQYVVPITSFGFVWRENDTQRRYTKISWKGT